MLVLSRKVNESIEIDGRIKVIIHKIKGNRVAIAIDAPDEVAIVRSELRDRMDPALDNRVVPRSTLVPCYNSNKEETDSFAFAI
jgi:carbon storage regulator